MSAATRMFSRTVSMVNSSRRWKVRARPRRARLWGLRRVMSEPSIATVPDVGGSSPVTTLNSVVLPAPFGPIKPVTRPSSAESEASSSAMLPPKRTLTPRTSSRGTDPYLVEGECTVDGDDALGCPRRCDPHPFEVGLGLGRTCGRPGPKHGGDARGHEAQREEENEGPVGDHVE